MTAEEAYQQELEARQWEEHRTLANQFRDECRALYKRLTKWPREIESDDAI